MPGGECSPCAAMGQHTYNQGLCSCQWAHSCSGLLLPTLAPTTMCVSANSSCSRLLLPPAAEYVHTTVCGHHCCLPWSLAAGPRRVVENPNSPCSQCRSRAVPVKAHTVVSAVDSHGLSRRGIMPTPLSARPSATQTRNWCPVSLDPESQCTSAYHYMQVKLFPY